MAHANVSGSVFIGMGVPTHDDCCENRVTEAHASGAHWAQAGRLLMRSGAVFMVMGAVKVCDPILNIETRIQVTQMVCW